MERTQVAIVTQDPDLREAVARAFDAAPSSWDVALYADPPDGVDVVVAGPDVGPLEGAVLIDPDAPDAALSATARHLARPTVARVLAVTGASGGVGVTTVALGLCSASTRRRTTSLFEAHHSAGVCERLALEREDVVTWDGMTRGVAALEHGVPVAPGFRAFIAPLQGEPTSALSVMRKSCDAVIVDCPSLHAPDLLTQVDAGVLVIPPTAPGAVRAAGFLDRFPELSWALVTNRIGPGSDLTRRRLEQRLGHPIAIELPCSASLRDAEDEGRLLTAPWSLWFRRIERLARGLIQ